MQKTEAEKKRKKRKYKAFQELYMLRNGGINEEYGGSLACCSPWGSKESDTTELLN